MRRLPALAAVVAVTLLATASTAWACGSLVAANGAVQLVRTSTLAAYHDGVEHYVTNFEFASAQTSFGSIIPLPAEPTDVERAGDWTLQRLELEVRPPAEDVLSAEPDAGDAADEVDVLHQTRIDSLDVTILRGGGEEVAEWAAQQGFELTTDTPEVLEFYARRSPYFMAARFDAAAAVADGFEEGDGVPVHLTIPTERPWVPLRILGTGKPADEIVQADVFLLTDDHPELLAGPGLSLERSESADPDLLADLRSDESSEWVPEDAWFSYLRLEAPVSELTYDLATDVSGGTPAIADTGLGAGDDVRVPGEGPLPTDDSEPWPWQGTVAIVVAGVLALGAGGLVLSPGWSRR